MKSEVAEEALEVDEGLTAELERELRIKDEDDDKDADGDGDQEEDVPADEVAEKWLVMNDWRSQNGFKAKEVQEENLVIWPVTVFALNPFWVV